MRNINNVIIEVFVYNEDVKNKDFKKQMYSVGFFVTLLVYICKDVTVMKCIQMRHENIYK